MAKANMQIFSPRRHDDQSTEEDLSEHPLPGTGTPTHQAHQLSVQGPAAGAAVPPGPVHHTPQSTERSVPECSTKRQVRAGKVGKWACVDFSSLTTEETMKFVLGLRDACVAIGMGFGTSLAALLHLNCDAPSVIESALRDVCGIITNHGARRPLLIVVILPDAVGSCDAKVEETCEKLGVLCQCCLPEHARTSSDQYLKSVACEISAKVLELNARFDSREMGRVVDMVGDDDSDSSSEVCGFDEDFVDYYALRRGQYGDSIDGSDSDDEDHCGADQFDFFSSSDSEMGEYADSEPFDESEEDESSSFHEETRGAESSEQIDASHEKIREGDGPEATNALAASHVANGSVLGHITPEEEKPEAMQIERRHRQKLPLPMSASFVKRNYLHYRIQQIESGTVKDWACVNFSEMYARVHLFVGWLALACQRIGMHFCREPMKTYHVKSAVPNHIATTFRGVRKSIMETFSRFCDELVGEPIGLLLVILPETRDYDGEIEEACKSLRVVYQCCLPSAMFIKTDKILSKETEPDKPYLKKTAREIKFKVVERDTFIPFVSEGPTFIFGADTSCDTVASVAASVDWQDYKDYRAVVQPNDGVIIQKLFAEHGGMIGDLLRPFCRKIKRDCRIIFFRHGISEDHISHVCRQEVLAIKQACAHLKAGLEPSVTYVVVGGNGAQEDGRKDDELDFLCNHGFVEGTKPGRYRVLLDENNLTFQDLESVIIKLCLLRNCWAYRDISMVPPAYSAWRAASRTTDELKNGGAATGIKQPVED